MTTNTFSMKIRRITLIKMVLPVVLTVFLIVFADTALSSDKFVISIPAEKIITAMQKYDRISEYTIQLSAARVYGITKLPQDWSVTIDDRVGTPALKAFGHHGASFLTYENVKNGAFTDFLVIEDRPPDWGQLEIRLDLTVDVFMKEKEKHILIEKKEMVITPIR